MRGALAWCAVALAAIPASAEEDEARRYIEAAEQLWDRLEYERALNQLERARKVSKGMKDDADIALLEGLVLAELNRWEEAESAFREGLYLVPDAKLPAKVSPKVSQRVNEIREEVKRVKGRTTTALDPPPAVETVVPPPATVVQPAPAPARSRLWIPAAAAGGAIAAAGAISFILAKNDAAALRTRKNMEDGERHQLKTRGETLQTLGVVGMGAGAVALGVAGWFFFAGVEVPLP